ncbi:dynein heavy chain, N-terminal region 1-domain-containing protein [Suillus ampliporus]|nr:dynein heavy chain, N-terminal region 1-domain-containing protein [Suillus ampliporus]
MSTPDAPATPLTNFNSALPHDSPYLVLFPKGLVALFDEEFDEQVARFTAEGGGVIYVVKTKDEVEEDSSPSYSYHLTSQLTYSPTTSLHLHSSNAVLLWISSPLLPHNYTSPIYLEAKKYCTKLCMPSLSCGVKPWFDAFNGARGGGKDGDSKMVIQRAVEQARSSGIHPNILRIPPKLLNNSSPPNTPHGHANMWIKAIQGVTKLTHDVSSGTASQEINFWLSLERALGGIETQLRSDEVNMVMEYLRNAKRYLRNVHKYNQLIKYFPLNELLSAMDLEKIQESLVLIFRHINRKLKLSPYPIHRALPLVEAISRCRTRCTRPLIAYLDRLNIFQMWDDLIKEFTNVAHKVMRKREVDSTHASYMPSYDSTLASMIFLMAKRALLCSRTTT